MFAAHAFLRCALVSRTKANMQVRHLRFICTERCCRWLSLSQVILWRTHAAIILTVTACILYTWPDSWKREEEKEEREKCEPLDGAFLQGKQRTLI